MSIQVETDYVKVYLNIRRQALRWLQICEMESIEEFALWLVQSKVKMLSFPGGYLFLNEFVEDVRVTLHPCFLNRRVMHSEEVFTELVDFVKEHLDLPRVQIRVFENAGHAIRKRLQKCGFVKDCTLQNYAIDRCSLDKPLLSVEIWAILKPTSKKET